MIRTGAGLRPVLTLMALCAGENAEQTFCQGVCCDNCQVSTDMYYACCNEGEVLCEVDGYDCCPEGAFGRRIRSDP